MNITKWDILFILLIIYAITDLAYAEEMNVTASVDFNNLTMNGTGTAEDPYWMAGGIIEAKFATSSPTADSQYLLRGKPYDNITIKTASPNAFWWVNETGHTQGATIQRAIPSITANYNTLTLSIDDVLNSPAGINLVFTNQKNVIKYDVNMTPYKGATPPSNTSWSWAADLYLDPFDSATTISLDDDSTWDKNTRVVTSTIKFNFPDGEKMHLLAPKMIDADNQTNTSNGFFALYNDSGKLHMMYATSPFKDWINYSTPIFDPSVGYETNSSGNYGYKGILLSDTCCTSTITNANYNPSSMTALSGAELNALSSYDGLTTVVTQAGSSSQDERINVTFVIPKAGISSINWVKVGAQFRTLNGARDALRFGAYRWSTQFDMLASNPATSTMTYLWYNISSSADKTYYIYDDGSNYVINLITWGFGGSSDSVSTSYFNMTLDYVAAADSNPPTYTGNSTSIANNSQFNTSNNYFFNITWNDTTAVNTVYFYTNLNSSYQNQTVSRYSGTAQSGLYSILFKNISAGNYSYRWFANDTGNNWNSSFPNLTYTITQADNPVQLRLNNGTNYTNQNITVAEFDPVTVEGTLLKSQAGTALLWRSGINTSYSTTIQPDGSSGIDTYLQEDKAYENMNYGEETEIKISNSNENTNHILLYFDTALIPNVNISNAAIYLTKTEDIINSYDIDARSITQSWGESTATWLNYDGSNPWITAGGDYGDIIETKTAGQSSGEMVWNITNLVKSWRNGSIENLGVALIPNSGSQNDGLKTFCSSDNGTASCRPKLVINYTLNATLSNPDTSSLPKGNYTYKVNTTGNANYSANATGLSYNVTVVRPPSISGINFRTTGNFTGTTFDFLQNMDWINATITSEDSTVRYANITVTNPNGVIIVNSQMNNVSSAFNYSGDFSLNRAGNWQVRIMANDSRGIWKTSTVNFTVFTSTLLSKDMFYGFGNRTVPTLSELTNWKTYDYNIIEFEVESPTFNNTWNSTTVPRIYDAYNNTLKVGIVINMSYNYSSITEENNFILNITRDFPSIATPPYSSTIMYVGLNPANRTFTTAQIDSTLNKVSQNLTLAMNNMIVVYAQNYTSANLTRAYIKDNPLIYVNESNQTNLINREKTLLRNNATLSRIYIKINDTLKTIAQNYHNNIIINLRSPWNSTTITNTSIAMRQNGDIIIFNNQSTDIINVPIDATGNGQAGETAWDFTNKYVAERNSDLLFNVNISSWSATMIYFDNIDHISYDSDSSSVVLTPSATNLTSNFTNGTIYGSWKLVGNSSARTQLHDPNYIPGGFMTYYGWLNASKMSYTEMCQLDVLLLADQNIGEINQLLSACQAINRNPEMYFYIALNDSYADTQEYVNRMTAKYDTIYTMNTGFHAFLDEPDMIDQYTGASTRLKQIVDYIQITKGNKVILNPYTTFQKYGAWGEGGFMKESCVNRWNGNPYDLPNVTFSREDWAYEISMSIWADMHGSKVLCQAFTNRTTDGTYELLNQSDAENIHLASKVLGYNLTYITHPDFMYPINQKYYDVGADISNGFSTNDDIVYYRRYEKGIVYYNSSNGQGWIDDNRKINNIQTGFLAYVEAPNTTTVNFSINHFNHTNLTGNYSISSVTGASWKEYSANISQEKGGRYMIDWWSGNHSNNDLYAAWGTNATYGRHSWYSTELPNSWSAYPTGQNWIVNLTINDSRATTIDTTTLIIQTVVDNTSYTNLTLSATSTNFNMTVWSGAVNISGDVTNITYLNGTTWVVINHTDTSDCASSNPAWNQTTINGNIYKACTYSQAGQDTIVRVAAPNITTPKIFQINKPSTPTTFIPPTPISCSATTGNFWVNSSCSNGTGNITNSMNKTNGTVWSNNSNLWLNNTLSPHAWDNISFYAWNNSGGGTLNTTPATLNTQVPNNNPVITDILNQTINEGVWYNITISGTDADSDTLTCSTDAELGTLTGCNFNWSVTYDESGNHLWTFTVSDGYGGTSNDYVNISVNDIPLSITSSNPATDPSTTTGFPQTFNITLNRTANVTWFINGTVVQVNTSVLIANYTNQSGSVGNWNVTADANDTIDYVSRQWNWTVNTNPPPNITAYWNDINGWNQTTLSINAGNSATFNITINQTIDTVSWKRDGIEQQNTSSLQYSQAFNTIGVYNITAQAFNTNGASQIIYTIVSVVESGGGGTNWDYLTGYVKDTSGTPINQAWVNTSKGNTQTNGVGYYSFGYVFEDGVSYWINASKTGYFGNNISLLFNEDHEELNHTLSTIAPPNITSWSNNKTNNQSLTIYVNTTEYINFNATANQTITTWNWYKNDADQSNNYNNFTTSFTSGDHTIKVNTTNSNGTSNTITWSINSTTPPLTYSVSGYTLDNESAILSSVTVSYSGGSNTSITNGSWIITGILNGTYLFTASKTGCSDHKYNITINGANLFTQNFSLAPTGGGGGGGAEVSMPLILGNDNIIWLAFALLFGLLFYGASHGKGFIL